MSEILETELAGTAVCSHNTGCLRAGNIALNVISHHQRLTGTPDCSELSGCRPGQKPLLSPQQQELISGSTR